MAPTVYVVCALTSLFCALLLLRSYSQVKKELLLWSGLCFLGLSISNALVFVDLVIFPDIDLYLLRLATAAVAMALLLYGLIWRSE